MKTQTLLLILFIFTFQLAKAQRISFAPDSVQIIANENGHNFHEVPFQFTFLTPPISTNGFNFYKTVNDVSLNTFLGISAGTNSLELAGFANVDLHYTKGLQIAGFANINGIFNNNQNYTSEGVQIAGFGIINGNSFTGLQASGFGTVNYEFSGVQASGFANINYRAKNSVEASGFANINYEVVNVIQAAGFANIAVKGKSKTQAAGFANISDDIKGIQAAGFANVANNVNGVQAAGFINVARNVKGLQLAGFINVCDSIDGIPISFISIVRRNGYRNFEFSTSEWAPMQISYRMGVPKLYNIYSLSKLPKQWNSYALGFGFGHTTKLADNTVLNLELTNHQTINFNNNRYYSHGYNHNSLLQFKPVFKQCIGNGVCLNFGPTLNYSYSFNHYNGVNPSTGSIQPFWKIQSSPSEDNYQSRSTVWIGFTGGISIDL